MPGHPAVPAEPRGLRSAAAGALCCQAAPGVAEAAQSPGTPWGTGGGTQSLFKFILGRDFVGLLYFVGRGDIKLIFPS